MNYYAFGITFLVSMPLVWYLLLQSNFEKLFKQGKIIAIRIAYALATLAISSILALGIGYFTAVFQNI